LEPRSYLERVLAVQEATGSRRLSKGSWSHTATTRQLEGAGCNPCPGGFGDRLWRYTGVSKTFGKRSNFSRGKMGSAPLQRVSVQCDHTTAGGRRTPFLTGRLWTAASEVHRSRQAIWKAFERFKRQKRTGATPKGQRRPVRPYDSWRAPDAILDREALESGFGGP
jgi:hypothetical protein